MFLMVLGVKRSTFAYPLSRKKETISGNWLTTYPSLKHFTQKRIHFNPDAILWKKSLDKL
jgi:hypothetical protein